jgi:aspartate/glutamate racemase
MSVLARVKDGHLVPVTPEKAEELQIDWEWVRATEALGDAIAKLELAGADALAAEVRNIRVRFMTSMK